MRAITPFTFVILLACIRWAALPPPVAACATPTLIEVEGWSVLNCHGLGRALTPRERCVLGLPVELNGLSPAALKSLFAATSVSRLRARRRRTGYLCLYDPEEIRPLISEREWALIGQSGRCRARP